MDQWFLQLFQLIEKQTESRKTEMLLPELQSEFDILVRAENKEALKDIYDYLLQNNPINTEDKTYNIKTYDKLKKDLQKKLVLLNDFTLIENEVRELVSCNNQKGIKNLFKFWDDHPIITTYIKDIIKIMEPIYSPKKEEKKPESVKKVQPKEETTSLEEKKSTKENEESTEQKIETPPKMEKKETIEEKLHAKLNSSKKQPLEEKKGKKEARLFKKQESKQKSKPIIEITPKPIEQEHVQTEKQIQSSKIVEEKKSKPVQVKPIIEKSVKNQQPSPEPMVEKSDIVNPKRVEPSKTEPVINEAVNIQSHKERAPIPKVEKDVEELQSTFQNITDYSFIGFMNYTIDKYHLIVDMDSLSNLSNPKPNFYRILLEYIESEERDTTFFLDLFQLVKEFKLDDFISFIALKSQWIKKLATVNIALLNEKNLKAKYALLEHLKSENIDFVKQSLREKKLRIYMDSLNANDDITGEIISQASKVSSYAPLLIKEPFITEEIDFFRKKIKVSPTRIIDDTNITHLYWSIVFATTLCVYAIRDKDYCFTDSIKVVGELAVKLANTIGDEDLKELIIALTRSYIRNIYKFGTKSTYYEDWWVGQKDSMLDAKLDAIGNLNLID